MSLLGVTLDATHTLAISCWIGGLVWILTAGFSAASRIGMLVRAWVRPGAAFVLVALITGVVSAWERVRTLSALTHTPYGSALIAKTVLALILVGLTFRGRQVALRATTDYEARAFGRLANGELAVALLIILVTAALVGLPAPHS